MEFTRYELYDLLNREHGKLWLANADLSEAQLSYARLEDAILIGANLESAILDHADLQSANMYGAFLTKASLRQANLSRANLHGVFLSQALLGGANFAGANISDGQFLMAKSLVGATMPHGLRYDGRFRLAGDLEAAQVEGINILDSAAMAAMYKVPLEEYREGQAWADENLK